MQQSHLEMMCSSRLAGAQQPTVLLSLKSSIVAALGQDLQLQLWGKQILGNVLLEQSDPATSSAAWLRKVSATQTMPSPHPTSVEENFTFSALTTFYSS